MHPLHLLFVVPSHSRLNSRDFKFWLLLLLAVDIATRTYHVEVIRGTGKGKVAGPLELHELEWVPCDQTNARNAADRVWLPEAPEVAPVGYQRVPQSMAAFERIQLLVKEGKTYYLFYQMSEHSMWAMPLKNTDLDEETGATYAFDRLTQQPVERATLNPLSRPVALKH